MEFRNALIAEDDSEDYEFFVNGIKQVLPACHIHRAMNGIEVFSLLKNATEKPDIIFLDLTMPLKNGIETLKLLKQSEELASIPVIMYSTSHYLKDIHTSYVEGAHCYVIKPMDSLAQLIVLHRLFACLNKTNERPGKNDFVISETNFVNHDYEPERIELEDSAEY